MGHLTQALAGLLFLASLVVASELVQRKFLNNNNGSRRVYEFINNGLALTVYKKLPAYFASRQNELTPECTRDFKRILEGLQGQKFWAHKFLDAVSKKPTGVLTETWAHFGDYDVCLDASSPVSKGDAVQFHGKHCAIEIAYTKRKLLPGENYTEVEELIYGRLPVFNFYNHVFTTCVPSTCTEEDVKAMTKLCHHLGFKEVKDITCDTKHSIMLWEKVKTSAIIQKVSLLYILTMLSLILIATALDGLSIRKPMIHIFSLKQNVGELFEDSDDRVTYMDQAKLFASVCITMVHSFMSLESPLGPYFVKSALQTTGLLAKLWVQVRLIERIDNDKLQCSLFFKIS